MYRYRCGLAVVAIASIAFSQNSLTGTVKKYDGTPVAGIQVVVQDTMNAEQAYATTDNAGVYTLPVAASLTHCNIMARINSMMTVPTPGIPKELFYTAFTKVPISGTTTKDVTLPRYHHIAGKVVDNQSNGIGSAQLRAKKWNGAESTPWDNCVSASDGAYSLYQEGGGVKIWVTAPAGFSDIAPVFSISSDTVINLTLPKPIAIHGTVRTYDNLPAANTIICVQWGFQQVDSLAHGDGGYSIPVQPGTYKIRLRSNSMNRVANAPVDFDTTITEAFTVTADTLLNLTLPRFNRVVLQVKNSQEAYVAGAEIRSVRGTGIGQLPRDRGQTDGAGRCTVFVGQGNNEITVTPATNSQLFELISSYTITSDTAITIILPMGVKCTGKVVRNDSSVVNGITMAFQSIPGSTQYEVKTDSTGTFGKNLQPGLYKVRIRNYSCPGNAEGLSSVAGVPCELEYTAIDSITLVDSMNRTLVLPKFPIMKGIVKNSSGTPVQGTRIYCRGWKNGYEQPPHDESYSGVDGAYQLVLGEGINRVWVVVPSSQPMLQSFDFVDNFTIDRVRDIVIPDQARGITRIQPSVISTGESGSVMINGINVNFTGGQVSVNLGAGVEVSNVVVVSNVTVTADVKVYDTAVTGTHDVVVTVGSQNSVGAGLLSITSPVSAKVALLNGETVSDVRISDGTGTEVLIPAGTSIVFPAGSDSVISYSAPLISGKDTARPVSGDFTDIQRELHPSGLVVKNGDSIIVTSHYTNQDVVGLNEATLAPYYFIDTAASGATSVGEAIKLLGRDTAKNTVTFAMAHFSMFRIASVGGGTAIARKERRLSSATRIVRMSNEVTEARITILVAGHDDGKVAELSVYNLLGKKISYRSDKLSAGVHSLPVTGNEKVSGTYIVRIRIGSATQASKLLCLP